VSYRIHAPDGASRESREDKGDGGGAEGDGMDQGLIGSAGGDQNAFVIAGMMFARSRNQVAEVGSIPQPRPEMRPVSNQRNGWESSRPDYSQWALGTDSGVLGTGNLDRGRLHRDTMGWAGEESKYQESARILPGRRHGTRPDMHERVSSGAGRGAASTLIRFPARDAPA
jgi:hypothetical protein